MNGNMTADGSGQTYAYDNGTLALTVNGVTDSAPYGEGLNATAATAATAASALILAVNNDPNAFVKASPNGSAGITLTSREPSAAADYTYSFVDNYDSYDFSAPSFAASPESGTMVGGTDPSLTQTPVYSYNIPTSYPQNTGYDRDGNVLSYTDTVMGNWNKLTYDPLNRLTGAAVSSGIYNGTNIAGATLGWTYDQFGNRLTQSSNSAALPSGSTQFPGNNNQATGTGLASSPTVSTVTFQYDASGNLTGQAGAVNQSIFDAEGRLCATPSQSGGYEGYLYDADGNRVAKGTITKYNGTCDTTTNGFVLTSQYLLGPAGEQMTELNGSGAWVHTNVTANGSLFASFDNDGKGAHFTLTDWLGTKRVQTNYLGAVEESCQSLPFGDALACFGPATDATEHHYTGKERDAESGLDYFGARYYASSMGRWMSPDWSAKEDPVPYAKLDNPQSLNLYGYVLNNPLSQKDDDGHEIIYADGLKNSQLVRDSVTAILANPNTSSYLSGYVGANAPNLIIQSGDLGPPTVTTLPNGQTLTTTVQGNTAPDIQTTQMNNDPPQTTLTGATITIDNNTSKGDTPGVMIHESVHAGEAQKNPAQFNKDAKAERGQPHDSRPQEQRANGVRAANEKQIKQQIKQIEKDRKKDQQ